MKTSPRNKITILAVAALLFSLSAALDAACPANIQLGNLGSLRSYQAPINGIPADGSGNGTIQTVFWAEGSAAQLNSGSLPTYRMISPYLNGYFVSADLGSPDVAGSCPNTAERLVFLYSIENNGHGQYLVMNTGWDPTVGAFNFDNVTNSSVSAPQGPLAAKNILSRHRRLPGSPGALSPVSIPRPSIQHIQNQGTQDRITVAWRPIQNLKGYSDQPPQHSPNIVTGIAVRYYQGYTAPDSFKTTSWMLAVGGVVNWGNNGNDPGTATIMVPHEPGLKTYIALTVLFDNAYPSFYGRPPISETAFVGENSTVSEAPASLQFTGITASWIFNTIRVSWHVDSVESVESFRVFWSARPSGMFLVAGDTVSPTAPVFGTFSQSFEVEASQPGPLYVRVMARLKDGTIAYSKTIEVTKGSLPLSPAPAHF